MMSLALNEVGGRRVPARDLFTLLEDYLESSIVNNEKKHHLNLCNVT